jgi:hypothetical protein
MFYVNILNFTIIIPYAMKSFGSLSIWTICPLPLGIVNWCDDNKELYIFINIVTPSII